MSVCSCPALARKKNSPLKPFFDQMRQLGWVEGQNIAYDRVYAEDQQERLPKLAAELVARNSDVIYAPVTPATMAARQATIWSPLSIALMHR